MSQRVKHESRDEERETAEKGSCKRETGEDAELIDWSN